MKVIEIRGRVKSCWLGHGIYWVMPKKVKYHPTDWPMDMCIYRAPMELKMQCYLIKKISKFFRLVKIQYYLIKFQYEIQDWFSKNSVWFGSCIHLQMFILCYVNIHPKWRARTGIVKMTSICGHKTVESVARSCRINESCFLCKRYRYLDDILFEIWRRFF